MVAKGAAETEARRVGFDDEAARLDRAAAELVRRVAPISFRLAGSGEELRAAFRLRYEAVVEKGWRPASDFPDGLEREADDARAVHLLGWFESRAVANCRMLFPRTGERLPVEEEYDLRIEPAGEVVQIDRICIARDLAEPCPLLLPALMSATWLQMRKRGYSVCAGLNSRAMLRLYQWVGFEHEILGPAQRSWSEERYPVRFTPLQVTSRFYDLMNDSGG